MQDLGIKVQPGYLQGKVTPPLSKSFLHRSLICAALAGDISLADLGTDALSNDILVTQACLLKLLWPSQDPLILACHDSGSTLRFMIPLVAAMGVSATLTGERRLPYRPLGEYRQIFAQQPLTLTFPEEGLYLPLKLSGHLNPGTFTVPGHISSQYISGLLMALPLLEGDSEIHLSTALESEPYVEITRAVMAEFGIQVERTSKGYRVNGGQHYQRNRPYHSETDYSQAAFWLVANYLGSQVTVEGLPANSLQGDQAIVEFLEQLKAGGQRASYDLTETVDLDLSQCPDLAPILAVAAGATPCLSRFVKAERLRLKESDRLAAVAELLTNLGIQNQETEDGLLIWGKAAAENAAIFQGGNVNSYYDHRLVMAAAVAATRATAPVEISAYRSVDKSYPRFFDDFKAVGGSAHELNVGN